MSIFKWNSPTSTQIENLKKQTKKKRLSAASAVVECVSEEVESADSSFKGKVKETHGLNTVTLEKFTVFTLSFTQTMT